MAEMSREEVLKWATDARDKLATAAKGALLCEYFVTAHEHEKQTDAITILLNAYTQQEEKPEYDMRHAIALTKTAIGIVADMEPENHVVIKEHLWKARDEMGKALYHS